MRMLWSTRSTLLDEAGVTIQVADRYALPYSGPGSCRRGIRRRVEANAMFDNPLIDPSTTVWARLGEWVATFGLVGAFATVPLDAAILARWCFGWRLAGRAGA